MSVMQKSKMIEKQGAEEPFTIIIGGNARKDLDELLSGKPLSEINQPKDALYLDTFERLHELLSPKKLDLLLALMENPKHCCVSETAAKIKRKQEAVSRDLKQLKKLGLVELKKDGQKTIPKPKFRKLEIRIM